MELLEQATDFERNPHMQYQLDASYRNLERALGSVTMADNKALIALTFQGAIVAGLALIAGFIKTALLRQPHVALLVIICLFLAGFFVCFCLATLKLFQTISPRITSTSHADDHPSFLFFFGSIARMNPEVFAERMRGITPGQIHDGVVTMTHNTARIAAQKFENLRIAYKYLGLQMVFYMLIVLLSLLPTTTA